MSDFALRAFCRNCNHMKRTMPFNDPDWHTGDNGPCKKCGDDALGAMVVAKEVRRGKWYRPKFVWVDTDGNQVAATTQEGAG